MAARRHVIAILRLSEAIADRAQVARNTLTESPPLQPIEVTTSIVESARLHVTFTDTDLSALRIRSTDLDPFVFESKHRGALGTETLGHTCLERRPLVRFGGHTIVTLPTAIGAAVRRFLIEEALAANDLDSFQAAITEEQVANVHSSGSRLWRLEPASPISIVEPSDTREFVGTFDHGSDVHVVYVPDRLADIVRGGLRGPRGLDSLVTERIVQVAWARTTHSEYRRGLTILIFGGIGRPYAAHLTEGPPDWHLLALPISDFVHLGWDHDLSARRAWKMVRGRRSRNTLIVWNI